MVEITEVRARSRADKAGILPDDILISINGHEINDVLDYRFYLAEKELNLLLKRNEEKFSVSIRKGEYDDIGLDFATPLMDKKHTCENKCIFCFIDQNPKGMRESIYFKDDDSRLSFLHGNYITLTNLKPADIQRIVNMRISPVNVSVHTTNPELRVKMMKNKHSGEVLSYLRVLADAGIKLRGQIVLCKGINDREELERSIEKLGTYLPHMRSVSVVPVGLTKYRDGLYPLEPFTKEDACEVIDMIERWQKKIYEEHQIHFIHASDEWYILAERELPEENRYDGYIQLENGVGMIRLLCEEVMDALDGKEDGLYFYRKIIEAAGAYLNDGAKVLFEIGHDQGEDVSKLMKAAGYVDVTVKKDLAGLDRVVFGVYNNYNCAHK